MSERAQRAFNAAVNVLAVEYLIKENRPDLYEKYINILYGYDNDHLEMLDIWIGFNRHIQNLGAMITQGDYDSIRRDLLVELDMPSMQKS